MLIINVEHVMLFVPEKTAISTKKKETKKKMSSKGS